MRFAVLGRGLFFGVLWLIAAGPAAAEHSDADLRQIFAAPGPLVVDGRALPKPQLERLYEGRRHQTLWLDGHRLTRRGWDALSVLWNSVNEGLDPAKYFVVPIQARVAARAGPGITELELLISAGLLGYVAEVASGRLEPKASDPELFAYPSAPDPVATLEAALDAAGLEAALYAMAPPHPDYQQLRVALARYRDLADAGGWKRLPQGPKLELGGHGVRVTALRARLAVTGDIVAENPGSVRFDVELEAAVKRFQIRHGLVVDGVVGLHTLAALNVSVEARIRQIQMNMERWRWLPRRLQARHVLINAADFELTVVENGAARLRMAVIVGRPYRRTPIFSSEITHMILNPDWTVPPRIARKDLLPKIRRDPDFLARQGFQVLSGWSSDATPLDPRQIDWQTVGPGDFSYKLRQRPGPKNALGRVKFILPNRYSVYLHDTPGRKLFEKTARPFSSGCVRLSRPIEFAEYLMAGAPGRDRAGIEREIATGKTQRVNLPVSMPVYFTYFTAWVDEAGRVQFRDDVYGRDEALFAALIDQLIIQSSAPASE